MIKVKIVKLPRIKLKKTEPKPRAKNIRHGSGRRRDGEHI